MKLIRVLFLILLLNNVTAQECELYVNVEEWSLLMTSTDTVYLNDTSIYAFEHGEVVTLNSFDTTGVYISSIENAVYLGNQQWRIICGALPVELISFIVKEEGDNNRIEWQTASEINLDYFTVEKSENGYYFYPISYVNAGGKYQVYDKGVKGLNYYRLKATDIDQTFEYFDYIVVDNGKIDSIQNPLPLMSSRYNGQYRIFNQQGQYLGMNHSLLLPGIYMFQDLNNERYFQLIRIQ